MQAITLWQPWATLIALGLKKIETRSWPATIGVPGRPEMSPVVWQKHGLAIHAAQRTPGIEMAWAFRNHLIRDALAYHGITESNWTGYAGSLPQGAIVAVTNLVDCIPTDQIASLDPLEQTCGNYTPGRWAWKLGDVVNLNTHPVGVRGRQRLWTPPLHTQATVKNLIHLVSGMSRAEPDTRSSGPDAADNAGGR